MILPVNFSRNLRLERVLGGRARPLTVNKKKTPSSGAPVEVRREQKETMPVRMPSQRRPGKPRELAARTACIILAFASRRGLHTDRPAGRLSPADLYAQERAAIRRPSYDRVGPRRVALRSQTSHPRPVGTGVRQRSRRHQDRRRAFAPFVTRSHSFVKPTSGPYGSLSNLPAATPCLPSHPTWANWRR